MNNISISQVLHVLNFLSDSIFLGSRFLVPSIFVIKLLNMDPTKQILKLHTSSVNILLLTGGIFFLIPFLTNLSRMWNSGNEYERDFIIGLATGSHWFQYFIPVFNFGLLINVMWFKKFRNSIYTSLVIVGWWLISYFVVDYLTIRADGVNAKLVSPPGISAAEYATKAASYTILYCITCIIIHRKNKYRMMKPVMKKGL
jgi:hypothetical protein